MKSPIFIILSGNRTGSTVIRRALDGHPDLDVEDEVLCFKDEYLGKLREKLRSELYCKPLSATSDLVPFLNFLFDRYNGFKIQRTDVQIANGNHAWSYLASKRGLKIIHLARRDKVRQYISLKIAEKSQVWHVGQDEVIPESPTIVVDCGQMLNYITGWERYELYFKMLFQDRPSIDVWYEDIQADIGGVLAYIQGFLGVELVELPVLYQKMIVQESREVVSNFWEVRERLRGTRWESFVV